MLRELIVAQEGKAIPYTMELTDAGGAVMGQGGYGAANPYNGGAIPYSRVQTPLSQREAHLHEQTYGGSEPVDWLMNAVSFTIQAASSSEFHFEDDSGAELVVKKDEDDPDTVSEVDPMLARLFDMPNPYMSWDEFIEVTLIDFLLVGNAYWVKWKKNGSGQPSALYRMSPQFVRIVPDQFGPAQYLYKVPGVQNEVPFDPKDVLHFRRTNPHSPYYGVGIVQGGARAIDMELALSNTSARYYENQALPSGVVETDRRVPKDVFNRLKSQLHSFYSGSGNAGQLMVLEAGLKFQTLSPTAGDALFSEMGAWSRDRILAMFHINKTLLGIDPGGSAVPISDWQRLFDQKTMIPLLGKFERAISRGLTRPGWNLDFEFDYEETQAPAEVLSRATLLAGIPGVKVRELREAAGLPASTGDESIDNQVLNMPGPNLDANGQGGFPDRNLPGEPGRPPLPANTRRIMGAPAAVAGGNSMVLAEGKSIQGILDALTVREYALKVSEGKALAPARTHVGDIADTTPPEDKLHGQRILELDNLTADMQRDILAAVHTLERGLMDTAEGKAEGTMYQRVKNSPAWAAFRARLAEILQAGAERGISLANIQHVKAGHEPNLDADYAALAKEQVYRPDGVLGIVKNFKQEVMQEILTLQRHGSNPGEFSKAIMAGIGKWKDGHAQMVALTEATRAYNEGTLQVAEANGMGHVLVSDGNDFDEPCANANGAIWTIEHAREHSIEHPNCRRAFVPTTQEPTA